MKRLLLFLSAICLLPSALIGADALPRGAVRSPAHKLLAAPRHEPIANPPAQVAYVPSQLDMWGNNQFGDCVSAEEAFAKACYSPEIFVSAQEVERFARQHGYLNGADLVSVLDTMQADGFSEGRFAHKQLYNDGPYSTVDYSSEDALRSALSLGPVKIAIDANALPSGAGNQQGWFALGTGQQFANTDHCVSICGCGSAEYLYSQLDVAMPSSLAGVSGYLVFTWSTIGFVDHPWIMSTCTEAFVRNPTTVAVPPLTGPSPPNPAPSAETLSFSETIQFVIAAAKTDLTQSQAEALASFFSDDSSPRVSLLKEIAYRRAVRSGAVPVGTPINSVNWQGLIQFIQALMPLIEQMIVLFGGDAPHAAVLDAPRFGAVLAAYSDAPKKCGSNGCPAAAPKTVIKLSPLRRARPTFPRKNLRPKSLSLNLGRGSSGRGAA